MINKPIRRKVWSQCLCAMALPIGLGALTEILTSTLLVITANTLGGFADAALALNFELSIENIIVLAVCVFLTIAAAPTLGLMANFSMLKHALRHDRLVFGRFFDKEPEGIANLGELQYELEDAPNELRIQMTGLTSKALALPVCTAYLLYCAGKISWLLTGIMLALAAIRLIVPTLFRGKLAKYDRAERLFFRQRRGYETDVTANPHIVKMWGIRIPVQARLAALFEKYYGESGAKNETLKATFDQSKSFAVDFTQILLFAAGAVTVASGYVTPGDFVSVLVYLGVAQTILENLGEIIRGYPLMVNAANRVTDLYSHPEPEGGEAVGSFDNLRGENISLSIDGNEILHSLSFEIHKGDKVAVVGENGSASPLLVK